MNRLLIKSAVALSVLATFLAGIRLSRAGDAIIFPSDKAPSQTSNTDPRKEVRGSPEKLKFWEGSLVTDPRNIEALARPGPRTSRKKTEQEKQSQRERDEKVNWLLLRPDQLREEHEEQEKVPFPDRDAETEERDDRRDYTFHGLDQPKDGRESPRRDQRSNPQTRNANASRSGAEDSGTGDGRKAPLAGKSSQDLGAHASRELDLSDQFDPNSGSRATEVGKSDSIWRDVLGSGGPTGTREQRLDRLDRLGSPLAVDTKWPSEFGHAPSAPTLPKPPDTSIRSGGSRAFGPNQDLGALSAPRSSLAQGLPDWTAPRSSVPSQNASPVPQYNPWDQQPANRPSVIRPTVLEIPQRKL